MYRAFNVQIKPEEVDVLLQKTRGRYTSFGDISIIQQSDITESLKSLLSPKKRIDVDKLKNDWFPEIDAQVFISHSHMDIALVEKIEKWLFLNFGIKSFVDSKVWGYANDLLKKIDNIYSFNSEDDNGILYDYEKRNNSTAHVHMILATALLKMIDKIDYIFFLNTPNSLLSDTMEDATYSPWIYYELLLFQYIRQKQKPVYGIESAQGEMLQSYTESKNLEFKYDVDLSELDILNYNHLAKWMTANENLKLHSALEYLDILVPRKNKIIEI